MKKTKRDEVRRKEERMETEKTKQKQNREIEKELKLRDYIQQYELDKTD